MALELISANHAAATAATFCARANRTARGFCSGVYPITPSTECGEFLCGQEIEKGHVVRVESEHSAMGVCIGAASSGARTFTTSAANGIAYMAENIAVAGYSRLPIVMVAANRALGPPWNIYADHGDTLLLRDVGWVQLYCADNQEVFDSVLCAYRLGEDPRIVLPVMVCQDGFTLSHTIAQTEVPCQDDVDRFLPPLELKHRLANEPRLLGSAEMPRVLEHHRREHQQAMDRVFGIYGEVQDHFEGVFRRRPADPVVPYRTEDADLVLVSMGTIGSTAETAADDARGKGLRVGALRVRMFRPFPEEMLRHHLAGKARVAAIDRNISLGSGGILGGELRRCLGPDTLMQNYLMGLGGGDVRPEHLADVIDDLGRRTTEAPAVLWEVGQ